MAPSIENALRRALPVVGATDGRLVAALYATYRVMALVLFEIDFLRGDRTLATSGLNYAPSVA